MGSVVYQGLDKVILSNFNVILFRHPGGARKYPRSGYFLVDNIWISNFARLSRHSDKRKKINISFMKIPIFRFIRHYIRLKNVKELLRTEYKDLKLNWKKKVQTFSK